MKDLDIIPECYIDTNLVETLLNIKGCRTEGVNHQKGCNTVVKTMTNSRKLQDDFALGIVDADKRQPSYVAKECTPIAQTAHITLLKHRTNNHYFLRIAPAMDTLILSCAKEAGINMEEYELTYDLKTFTKITKEVESKNDPRFKKLFKQIKGTAEMTALGNVLEYLRGHKYDAEEDELKKLLNISSSDIDNRQPLK